MKVLAHKKYFKLLFLYMQPSNKRPSKKLGNMQLDKEGDKGKKKWKEV